MKKSPLLAALFLTIVAVVTGYNSWKGRPAVVPDEPRTTSPAPQTLPPSSQPRADKAPDNTAPPERHESQTELALSQIPADERAAVTAVAGTIDSNGPFPYAKDGTIFRNAERRLPSKDRRYYREYTVPTPGSDTRGARRLISGQKGELFYTNDHYRTFVRIR